MNQRRLAYKVLCLSIAGLLFISLISANAAAVPKPDEIEYPEEVIECPELTQAVNPLSDKSASEYWECKQTQQEQEIKRSIGPVLEDRAETYHNLKDQIPLGG